MARDQGSALRLIPAVAVHAFFVGEEILPDGWMEQEQEREQLQPPCQHVKHQDIFGEGREETEVCRGADQFQTGADIVDGRCHRREPCHQIGIVKGDQKYREDENDHERDEVHVDRAHHFMFDGFIVHLYFFDALGMNVGHEFLAHRLEEDREP